MIVYPNPFKNIIFINDQTNNNQFWNLKLYNSEGKILLEEKKVNQLNLEFLENGMYIIHISDVNNNFKESFKISKFN
ncbi:MAG: T9SS type A sorting domain-containing protein [Saprospiraceae bacterium]|nr:T9SS type A sorting domain-containing protein [Saprospiraceae bacterium]